MVKKLPSGCRKGLQAETLTLERVLKGSSRVQGLLVFVH